MPTYEIRLMFEWGGACLWGMNEAATSTYGYAEIENVLPLSPELKAMLATLSARHDTALNWSDPMAKGPWTKADYAGFEREAQRALKAIQTELGRDFHVTYAPLGTFE